MKKFALAITAVLLALVPLAAQAQIQPCEYRAGRGVVCKSKVYAPNFVGNVTGNVTGAVTGGITGNTSGTHTGAVVGNVTGTITLPTSTVAALPTCAAGLAGTMRRVSDATTPTYNGALTGGGAVIVPVFCDGTAWTSH